MKPSDLLTRILNAPVYDVATRTPLDDMPRLGIRCGNRILLKREDLQPVFSFKLRGAYNCLANLPSDQRAAGVVASSAGNHAQGVALAARELDCTAHIVMPVTTPSIKVEAVEALRAKVILHGDSFDDALQLANRLATERGWTMIHAYDNLDVIAGQGTIGLEILRQCRKPVDAIFVPIGGGGLAAGIGAYVKSVQPDVHIIGVEPEGAASMQAALEKGEPAELERVELFADGVAVKQAGQLTFDLCRQVVDEIVLVDTDAICAAIKDGFEDTRTILEPAGALSIAGCKAWIDRESAKNQNLVAVASGANMNFGRLRHVSERAEIGEAREALLAVTIPEHPGSFQTFISSLGDHNITEFNYRYAADSPAHVFVGVELETQDRVQGIRVALSEAGYAVEDFTQNELAKLHLRHVVGGRVPGIADEKLYRFQFPERPGALSVFLSHLNKGWNISLFHYRNHGSNFARVLVGIQVPTSDAKAFEGFLDRLGYTYWDESNNPAYDLFLGG